MTTGDSSSQAPAREWNRFTIAAKVREKGYSLASLEEELGLTKNSLSRALQGPYPRADRPLAGFLGVPLHVLWPDRYNSNGERIGLIRRPRQTAEKPPVKPKTKRA